jgi:transcriptional regulator with XRE-family HTH domain
MALEDLGVRIRALRKQRGLAQEALARRADVSLNLVGRLELGMVKNPHYLTLAGLARALDVTVEELVEEPSAPLAHAPSAGQPSQESEVDFVLEVATAPEVLLEGLMGAGFEGDRDKAEALSRWLRQYVEVLR